MTSIIRGISVCLCGVLFFATMAAQADKTNLPSDQSVAASRVPDDRYRIGYQDMLEIQVDRHSDLNQRVPVNANGTIELFRIDHPIVAVCKTERELATDIAAA